MKTIATAATLLLLLVILTAGCTKEALTGNAVKATVSDSGGNATNSGIGEEGQEGCAVDSGLLDRIFSGHGSL
ncbi:hypothetical protein HYU16_05570 [Candidatus Woesearchaeota archaeon]|nr:hypothetical protein [Candidatus Woesearchaeota archaeon]